MTGIHSLCSIVRTVVIVVCSDLGFDDFRSYVRLYLLTNVKRSFSLGNYCDPLYHYTTILNVPDFY